MEQKQYAFVPEALRQAQNATPSATPSQRPVSHSSATSTPLSSAPATPLLPTPRRPSYPATSPLQPPANSPNPHTIRRTSSAMSLGARSTPPPPKLGRKNSRQSLGGAAMAEDGEKRPTPKRSISNLIANLREAQGTMERIEEPVTLTAAQIATDHFMRELLAHGSEECEAESVVVLHDACYGHRYSRLKSTKSTLSMIVERPERIQASALGAAAAYVRLGRHYAGGRNAPHPERETEGRPPFKIRRTARAMDITSSYVTNVHGTAWMSELQSLCHAAGDRLAAGEKELSRASTPAQPEQRKLHEGDLYLSPESLDAFQGALGGVADALDTVFNPSNPTTRAFVAIRPPGHHCSAEYPSGFCWLNNVHVGIEYAAQTHGLTHAAILDFDLHHGDGSQAITWERNSRNNQKRLNAKPNAKVKLGPDIGYYSLHDINSYPCEMGDDEKVQAASLCVENAHGQSVWNIHLQPWKTEEEFWELYESRYRVLLDKARLFLQHHTARLKAEGKMAPKAAVFISAGFDASEWEGAGMQRHKVNVPTEFYARFTRDVVALAREGGTGCEGRVVSVLEGGYSDRALCSGVLSHLSGLCASPAVETVKKEAKHSANVPLDELLGGLRINGTAPHYSSLQYDKSWWSAAQLMALENKIHPPPPPQQGKRVRTGPQRTYATPTESFAYKVVDPNKFARSISGTMREAPVPIRPPTPPLPEVDWVVATQELVRLLIPTDRQTGSCTAEELGGVRMKKERQSAAPVLSVAEEVVGRPRQLRERRAKVPARYEFGGGYAGGSGAGYAESAHSDEVESVRSAQSRSVSRASDGGRRQTIAEFLPSTTLGEARERGRESGPQVSMQRRASRRLSAGSALSGGMDGFGNAEEALPVPALPGLSSRPPTANGAGADAAVGAMKPPPFPVPVMPGVRGGMNVKKTRAPSKARKAPSAQPPPLTSTATLAAASAPVSPITSTTTFTSTTQPAAVRQSSNLPAGPTTASTDLDRLTSGMKRVSLKVGTREESERKARERESAERRARALKGAETRRVNAAAKKAGAGGVGGVGSGGVVGAAVGAQTKVPEPALAQGLDGMGDAMPGTGLLPLGDQAEAKALSLDGVNMPADQHLGLDTNGAEDIATMSITAEEGAPEQSDIGLPPNLPGIPTSDSKDAEQTPAVDEHASPFIDSAPQEADRAASASPLLLPQADASRTADQTDNGAPLSPMEFEKMSLPLVPDSAARQLIQGNNFANGRVSQKADGSSSPTIRSPSNNNKGRPMPVWSSTGPIPFATANAATPISPVSTSGHGLGLKPPSSPSKSHVRRKVNGSKESDGNGVSKTMLEAQDEVLVDGPTPSVDEMSIWEVPETPQREV